MRFMELLLFYSSLGVCTSLKAPHLVERKKTSNTRRKERWTLTELDLRASIFVFIIKIVVRDAMRGLWTGILEIISLPTMYQQMSNIVWRGWPTLWEPQSKIEYISLKYWDVLRERYKWQLRVSIFIEELDKLIKRHLCKIEVIHCELRL